MKYFTTIFLSLFLLGEYSAQVFTNYTTAEGLADNGVNCVAVDADDNIWFGTNKGISKFDGVSTWETMNVADGTGLLDDVITAIHITEFGEVWVGTDFGICRYTNGEFTCYTDENDIGNKRVQAITEGIEGDMFFGNRSGYARLDAMGDWSSFGVADGIPFGGVKDIEVGSNGTIWLALGLSGIIIKASNGDQFAFQEPAILSNSVTGIVLDGGEAWISSGAGVDNFTNLSTDIFIPHPDVFELPPPHTLNQVVDVQIDSKGRVWAGIFIDYLVNVGGITFLEDEVWTSFDVDD